jgi:hypothetical protein
LAYPSSASASTTASEVSTPETISTNCMMGTGLKADDSTDMPFSQHGWRTSGIVQVPFAWSVAGTLHPLQVCASTEVFDFAWVKRSRARPGQH